MINNGYIKLFRKFSNWEWYTDETTKSVFIHCLIKANHKDKKWRGILIKKGSFITSYNILAKELGLSVQNVRTAIKKLKSTNELTIKTTNKGTTINVVNYSDYQEKEVFVNKQNNTPTNKQLTTTKNVKEEKNDVVVQQAFNDSDFITFWNCCRKKSRKFMKDTYECWVNMDIDKELLEQIVIGVKGYCNDPKIEYKFMKYPRTILEDEIWKEYCETMQKESQRKKELQKETDRQLLYFHEIGTTRKEFLEKGASAEKLDELEIYE